MAILPTRRSLLAATTLAGFLPAIHLRPARSAEPQALRIPELIDARRQGQSVALRAQAGRTIFFPGGPASRTLGYNGSYLGPTIRVHRGDEVEVAVANALGVGTTVHWHGLLVPGPLDGGPHQMIAPGATWRPRLPIRQPAATLLYHSHVHGGTAEQVYAGLMGLLLVTDEEERALGLPFDYGVDDIPVVLQDRQFEEGVLVLPGGMPAMMLGRRGDTILANGTPDAVARPPAGLVRLRLANGANARLFDLSFEDGRAFHWIASEGGLLERPVPLRAIRLAPGERAEVLVDLSDGRPVALRTAPDTNLPMMGMMARMGGFAPNMTGEGQTVLRLEPRLTGQAAPARIPGRLVSRERSDPSQAVRRRRVALTMGMGMGGMMQGEMGGGMMGRRGIGGPGGAMGGMHGINGRPFEMGRIDARIRLGDVEIWEASGEMMAHPLHIHGVHFEVLGRDGGPADPRDQGLRDTVLVRGPTELLVRFTQPAPDHAPFMLHCHVLEHEDNGMMAQFVVA
ncbi:multicopper oxidase domain-containing protein [Roseomonas sp. E05]|uniref:multicopper oxidase family protein n=1 Tax=Roseomonas sp. E05 TaxID=3046310 RepID=UPI0024BB6637|nr:multicopper oxidase domain-containing protein [Roseomonas sp. E05]MDJ0391027.1 multicopper oxidase domain-containing protein [Roseomonas sp. E05]